MKWGAMEPLAVAICGMDWPKHWDAWEKDANTYDRILAICSRDMGKSTFFSTLLPLFRCGQRHNYSVCIISYSEEQVVKIVSGIAKLVETRPLLKNLRPKDARIPWSKTQLQFDLTGSTINSLTFGSSGRGGHYDLVLVDDPTKDFSGMDPDDQERYFKNAIIPMVKPDGQLIMCGTYVYDGDLIERTEANSIYHKIKDPSEKNGVALWPERWPIEKLKIRAAEIGTFAYGREYLLLKIDPATQFFQRSMVHYYDELPEVMSMAASLDPAITLEGDGNALVITGTGLDGKTRLLDYFNLKSDNVSFIVGQLFDKMQKWNCKLLRMESIGFQRLLRHWINDEMTKRKYFFGVDEVKSYNKSKEARIMALQPRLQSGNFLFGRNQQEVVDQFMIFPRGKHDDIPDALANLIDFWDSPSVPTARAPVNSFDWWAKQLQPEAAGYQSAMFQEFASGDAPSGLTRLQ